MSEFQLIVISGLSGSGKTHALKCFEDEGYFCVDNLPPALLPTFVELCRQQGGEVRNVALGIDIRERAFLGDLTDNLDRVKERGFKFRLLFFEAREDVLARRFSESRRPHPVMPNAPLLDAVRWERERLHELRSAADRIIDTSDLTVHELKGVLERYVHRESAGRRMTISLVTFGYKFGVPYDIDLLFDVRFMRNPYFHEDLKHKTGEDSVVQSYVLQDDSSRRFVDMLLDMLRFAIPLYERERRSYLNIGFGCTGGRHRSIAIACHVKEALASSGFESILFHRDIHKV
ncbi:nucleotide-binding protein [Nitrospira sp.]|nr:nucleotide-binding protein [Nitrospira sp.]